MLRQAMALSRMDQLLIDRQTDANFVYGAYSAGCCVLSPTLKPYQHGSDPNDTPYPGLDDTPWTGLGLIDFAFMPHYQSEHREIAAIDREIAYCERHGIAYRTVADGRALVIR